MLKKIRERLEAFAEKLSYKHMLILAGVTSLLLSVLVYSIISKATVPAKPLKVRRQIWLRWLWLLRILLQGQS